MISEPTRNFALELVRVTEAAALSAGRFMGRGDKNAADRAAVEAMRLVLNTIYMNAVIVIGKGKKIMPLCCSTVNMLETGMVRKWI